MSSPGSPGPSHAGTKKHTEQVTFKFCPECSNMLYPKEDKEGRRLMYTCRTCQHSEEATSNCIYRNVLKNTVGETAGVTQDVASDPTVSRDGPATGPNTPTASPPSALVLCGCCGQVIMCSDCGLRPAAVCENDDGDEDLPSSPPETYQEEILEQMIVDEDALNRMLNNITDMTDSMDLDEDDWEPEPEEVALSRDVQNSSGKSVAA
ncbi:DNA-directed RNA polymerase II subunit RPB9 [Cytospora mali]|uniref:DNA-directed RNA polymerase II subunit RPB9 n=1 Tax=Cytospora mali TaxID=578113 RepID=A0A194VKE4_CYTMA|nr:DNA-directed RNA polymerase II subunit RPB9 [Valsa mali]